MKRDTAVNLRMTTELRAQLQRLADADGRKLSGYIVRVLELHAREQLPGSPPDSSSTARSPNSRRQAS